MHIQLCESIVSYLGGLPAYGKCSMNGISAKLTVTLVTLVTTMILYLDGEETSYFSRVGRGEIVHFNSQLQAIVHCFREIKART